MYNEIVYPIFLDCCQYTSEPYWKNVFEDLAYNRCPPGIYIKNNCICYKQGGKEIIYQITYDDTKKLFDKLQKLFMKKLKIISTTNRSENKKKYRHAEHELKQSVDNWSSIRKKNIRDNMIARYVINMQEKYKLSNKNMRYLRSKIIIGLLFNTIQPQDIIIEDNEIIAINGIEFRDNKLVIKKSINNIEIEPFTSKPDTRTKLADQWPKFLKRKLQ